MNRDPNISYIDAQIQAFDNMFDNTVRCEVSEQDLKNTQILAELGIFRLFVKEIRK